MATLTDQKPCPFCNSTLLAGYHIEASDDSLYIIECQSCSVEFRMRRYNEGEALHLWNDRQSYDLSIFEQAIAEIGNAINKLSRKDNG